MNCSIRESVSSQPPLIEFFNEHTVQSEKLKSSFMKWALDAYYQSTRKFETKISFCGFAQAACASAISYQTIQIKLQCFISSIRLFLQFIAMCYVDTCLNI